MDSTRSTGKRAASLSPSQVLGQAVRRQRKRLRLTQADLCLHAGVGLAFLYGLEAGKPTARLDKVLAVLKALGITASLQLDKPGPARAGPVRDDLPGRGAGQ